MATVYEAKCVLDEDDPNYWIITVPEVPGVITQAKSLKEAKRFAQEATCAVLDVEDEQVEIKLVPQLEGIDLDLDKLADLRAESFKIQNELAELSRKTVGELTEAGLTRKDAAELLGISANRVQQLLTT